jgi:ATP-dependent helicase/nuclease subunit A
MSDLNRHGEQSAASNSAADLATARQREAAQPGRSVSLRASAGSGKTRVLVDRFLRLCIEDPKFPADPASILAVTFTRKAAVEIKERLLSVARKLALAEEADLRRRLGRLFAVEPAQVSAAQLQLAAGLYERMLGDVSSLNVGTIHSFCQTILNRFAAEAGHDPHAALLENTRELLDEALETLERQILTDPDLARAARVVAGDPGKVRHAVEEAFKQRLYLDRWLRGLARRQGLAEVPAAGRTALLPAALADLQARVLNDWNVSAADPAGDLWQLLARALPEVEQNLAAIDPGGLGDTSSTVASMEKELAKVLQGLNDFQADWAAIPDDERGQTAQQLGELFLTKDGAPRKRLSRNKDVALKEEFTELVAAAGVPVLNVCRAFTYLELLDRNAAVLGLTLQLLDLYDAIKRRDQVLDFHDLEELACTLMGDDARALSLLYRLDEGLNHILLDEFQDTNFNQWEILEPFIEEFLAGDEDRPKTVFLVGDVKQSIYAFRGAESRLFLQATEKLKDAGQLELTLPTNFRSLEAVVSGVGCVFNHRPLNLLLPPGESAEQKWSRIEDPGQVIVLDPFPGEGEGEDMVSGSTLAARSAARWARRLVEAGALTWDDRWPDPPLPRPLQWDDILVLCRGRTEIAVYEKAFREEGIPIVSAGRGMLAAGREVQDVLALLRWLTYPQDDVALGTVLRSPIFRLSEVQLQEALALRQTSDKTGKKKTARVGRLWPALRQLKETSPLWPVMQLLRKWRGHLGRESAHDLLRRIYREGQVLERYELALGDQARQNLLRLFDMSLAAEVAGTPTLRRLARVIDQAARQGGEDEADAPMTGEQGRVRFMTIHGAKGLERPVVFLADADRKSDKTDTMLRVKHEDSRSPVLFKADKALRQGWTVPGLPSTQLEKEAGLAQARREAEGANLLYVAMTRARDRLVVLGGDLARGGEHDSTLRRLIDAAASCPQVQREVPGEWDEPLPESDPAEKHYTEPMARERRWTPPAMGPLMDIQSPSAVAEQEDHGVPASRPLDELPDTGARQAALARGNLVHALLQQAADCGQLPPGEGEALDEARAIFTDPDLAWVFNPATVQGRGLSEAPVIQRLASNGKRESRVTGSIDRLVIRPGRVDIIDYKTNRVGDDAARLQDLVVHYGPQLKAYRETMAVMFPGHELRTWLLFTDPNLTAESRLQEVKLG